MGTYNNRAAEVMEHLCTHDGDSPGHGYSQYSRWGDGTFEEITLSDGTKVKIAGGDRDCSAAVIDAWETVLPGSTAGATYTGNMRKELVGTGLWQWHTMGDGYVAQRGDIYLNETHHAAMCISAVPDMLAQFSLSETNGIDGKEGDQTGHESNIKAYYNYPWDGKLVYVGKQPEEKQEQPVASKLDTDGLWGEQTTRALQRFFNLVEDGVISGQYKGYRASNPGIVESFEWLSVPYGSPTISAIQARVGVEQDGILGPKTISAMQRHFGTPVDGELWKPSECIKAMQTALNSGKF